MLEERDQRSADPHDLVGSNVHILQLRGRREDETGVIAAGHAATDKLIMLVKQRIRLRNNIAIFGIGRQVFGISGDERDNLYIARTDLSNSSSQLFRYPLAFLSDHVAAGRVGDGFAQQAAHQARVIGWERFTHPAVWGFDETVLVDPGK